MPLILPKPKFMPRYLVRISDMELVKGSEVHEGYCTLSYSWNQSGEILLDEEIGKSYRIDQGKHKIIFPGKTVRKKPRGRKRISSKVKFVTFEGLIQEICKDFNIKYIWYDQMCINQNNENEKHDEMRHMHKIYGNAYCTLALVPELGTGPYKFSHTFHIWQLEGYKERFLESQWMKRMWTLAEALMSSKILVVGHNIHSWGHQLFSELAIPIFDEKFDCSVSRVLHYAHTRTSTKDYDYIFALANIFPDIMKQMTMDYNQNIQELMIQFYSLLAEKDIGILCFDTYHKYKTLLRLTSRNYTKYNNTPMQKFDLPSWTGKYGEHDKHGFHKTSFKNYTVNGRILKITCCGITNKQYDTEEISKLPSIENILPPFPQQNAHIYLGWRLVIWVQPQGSMREKPIDVGTNHYETPKPYAYKGIVERLQELAHFMSIKKTKLQWIPHNSELSVSTFAFDVLEGTLQDSGQCIVLTGIPFKDPDDSDVKYPVIKNDDPDNSGVKYPVIKKDGDYYKAIGMCHIYQDDNHFFDNFTLEEQTFEIH
ncbi:hypothetical protein INT45_006871 [Circinella minor]|uniref:Heterokaryon incompatibility domain-containing protein n=1 Tax=Circinella minor TaxID=1195481 RepID=A0A8H7VK03_9FUNG|nr:hypothetical protein INT45_006871 [Circinella minor]